MKKRGEPLSALTSDPPTASSPYIKNSCKHGAGDEYFGDQCIGKAA